MLDQFRLYSREKHGGMVEKKESLVQQDALLKRATRRKTLRFVLSGLIVIVVGCCIVAFGLTYVTHADSPEALVVGLGVGLIVVGIIRLLIGVINPAIPSDLQALPPAEASQAVDALFAHEGDAKE